MFFKTVYWVAFVLFWPIYRFRFYGRENIPQGAVVICANHTALIDSVLLILALGPRGNYGIMAKAELFQNKLIGAFLKGLHAFPVQRGKNDITAIKNAFSILKEGKQLIIFPEGTRVKEEPVAPKTGAAMFALRTGTPVMPAYITAGKKAFRKNNVVLGKPFLPSCEGKPGNAEYQQLADRIMREIDLLGQKELSA